MKWTLVLSTLALACARAAALGYAQQYPPPPPPAAYSPYSDYDDYYFLPKPMVRYPYYPLPAYEPESYRPAYPYYYKPLAPLAEPEDPLRLEERAAREAALPVGQETWYESEPPAPRWRQAGLDDVNAAFLQNLIISQMARNAENRARAFAPQQQPQHEERDHEERDRDERDDADSYGERDTRDFEDEDVRELKALAGKPLYHSAKTEPRAPPAPPAPHAAPTNNYDYYDYPADDSFINWGSKRAAAERAQHSSAAPSLSTSTPAPDTAGQREEVMLRPATPVRHPFPDPVMKMLEAEWRHEKRATSVYDKIKHMLAAESDARDKSAATPLAASGERQRLKKRFVASEPDLVAELRGLKRRIAT